MDVQNNNLSFVSFQSFKGGYKENAVKDERKIHSMRSYERHDNFATSRVISSERKDVSENVTLHQFKNQRMAKRDTFKQYKNGEVSADGYITSDEGVFLFSKRITVIDHFRCFYFNIIPDVSKKSIGV